MPPREPDPQLVHQDAAGWVLGVLDRTDAGGFAAHLPSCSACQAAVDELRPVAGMLQTAAPAALPPPDLRARTLARVRQASAESPPDVAPQQRQVWWRGWRWRLLAPATAVAAAAAVSVGLLVSQPAPALSFTIALHPVVGQAASGQAVAHRTGNGWSIQLTVRHLHDLGPGRFYECWYAGPGSRPGHPDLITAGTFTTGSSGIATVQMWSAADPRAFPTMQITAQTAGDGSQHGQVILSGTANS